MPPNAGQKVVDHGSGPPYRGLPGRATSKHKSSGGTAVGAPPAAVRTLEASSPLKKSFGREPALSVQSRPRQNSETTQVASVSTRKI